MPYSQSLCYLNGIKPGKEDAEQGIDYERGHCLREDRPSAIG
jgi:hypothetical protein